MQECVHGVTVRVPRLEKIHGGEDVLLPFGDRILICVLQFLYAVCELIVDIFAVFQVILVQFFPLVVPLLHRFKVFPVCFDALICPGLKLLSGGIPVIHLRLCGYLVIDLIFIKDAVLHGCLCGQPVFCRLRDLVVDGIDLLLGVVISLCAFFELLLHSYPVGFFLLQ